MTERCPFAYVQMKSTYVTTSARHNFGQDTYNDISELFVKLKFISGAAAALIS